MTWLLALLPGRMWLIGGAIAIALGAFLTQSVRLHLAQHDFHQAVKALQEVKAEQAIEHANALQAAVAAADQYRALESSRQRQKDEADAARQRYLVENARLKSLADSYSAQLGGLRQQLSDAASGSRPASEDSVADCRRRADAIADVLAAVVRLDAEAESDLADAAEREAADARGLREAWPRE